MIRRYKITKDTCLNRFQQSLLQYPYSSQAIVRKDINKSLMVVSDNSVWKRILYSIGPANIDNTQAIKSYGDNPGDVTFDRPAGVAVDVYGNIFVADDDNDRIVMLRYNWNNGPLTFVRTIQSNFNNPVDVEVTVNMPGPWPGYIWVVDKLNHRIVKLDYYGNYISSYGTEGNGVGQFCYPTKIARGKAVGPVGNEQGYYLYVLDAANNRVVLLKHNHSTNTTEWITSRPISTTVSDITFDGELLWVVESPFTDRLVRYKADLQGDPIVTFGSKGTGDNQFLEPRSMCIAFGKKGNGDLAVFDRAFVTELWGPRSGGQMYQLGVDILNLSAPYGQTSDQVIIQFDLTDYCYLTVKVKKNGSVVATYEDNNYVSCGCKSYTFTGGTGNYVAEIVAKSRYEPIVNNAPIEVIRTCNFTLQSGGGGGGGSGGVGDPPPGCPFLLPFTAIGYEADNNLIPNSAFLPQERDTIDYYKLQTEIQPQGDFYYLMLAEDYQDISEIDQVQLITVDYPHELNIAVTPVGEIIHYKNQSAPIQCETKSKRNCLEEILNKGDGQYFSSQNGDTIICTFYNQNPNIKGGVGIVARCKQSLRWMNILPKSSSESNVWSRINWSEIFCKIETIPAGAFLFEISWSDSIMIDQIFFVNDEMSALEIDTLNPIYAFHSKYDDVLSFIVAEDMSTVNLRKGERIILAFQNKPTENKRSFILRIKGKYTRLPIFSYINSPFSTAFTQGRHLARIPNSKEIYMTFESEGKIYLSLTGNEGNNWETEKVDEGVYPCVGINCKGLPWIAYVKDGDLICKMKRTDGSWKEILIFDGQGNLFAGPPSMQLATMPIKEDVIDYAYVTYPVYEGTMPDSPSEQPPENISASYIYITLFDTLEARTHLLDIKTDPNIPLSHPCVAVTPADLIHIVWQQKDEIWYITNTNKVTPENWKEVQWTPAYNLSNTADISEHPFVESYGDIVSVVWKEGNPGEIIRKQRYAWEPSEYEKWSVPENLSNSPDANSDYPQMSAGDVTLWQEQGAEDKYKVFANIQGKILCLTPDANNVSYVHANALVLDPKAPQIMVYYCYTDEITENELYEVKFDKYLFPDGVSGDIKEVKYYDGKTGNETASPYLVLRTGYIDYGDWTIDYGNRLEYLLKYLDPCKHYQFQAIFYQDTTGTIRQKLEVEDTLEATIRIYRAEPETINIFISPDSYQEDLESALEIIKTRGPFAMIAEFKVYEYEVISDSGDSGSGAQSAGLERLDIPTMLYAPKPNPFTNQTQIRFQIPVKTKVNLKVYNSAGRLVNTLVSDKMRPGYYTMSWNGKDDQDRSVGNGIYFVRLITDDYNETKKIVMMK
ncbi:MAG: T9SS type A sorting domain-containing protein [candidate division WOR-3 bacterium]